MRIVFLLLVVAVLAAAAPPEKQKEKKPVAKTSSANDAPKAASAGKPKQPEKEAKGNTTEKEVRGNSTEIRGNFTEHDFQGNNTGRINATGIDGDDNETSTISIDYCYDSSFSFKCRQTNPAENELECRIANADGAPCFPDLVRMIEAAAPLSTITYPIHSFEALEAAEHIENTPTIVTPETIEAISLHAPFERIPADAFASLPRLKRITLESLDGVKSINVDRNAFRNSTAKHLHLAGHNIPYILAQKVDLHYFDTITFSDVEIECYHNSPRADYNVSYPRGPQFNVSCEHLFDNMRSVEKLNLESIYVRGDRLDERVLRPLWDSLKKLTLDVVYRGNPATEEAYNEEFFNNTNSFNRTAPSNASTPAVFYRGYFPVETFAYMTRLEDLELYLYEPIIGFSVEGTAIPLPVSKTLTRFALSCRYCKNIDLTELGRMLPNLRQLTIAAPIEPRMITAQCLKSFAKLEELIIYDGDVTSIRPGAFRSTESLKQLTIKYAPIDQFGQEHMDGLEDTLQSLTVVGTRVRYINVSRFEHLVSLDVSQNRLTAFERSMFPQKSQFSELNLSYNPIKRVENGFLSGVELKNRAIRFQGWDIESFDVNAVDGMEKVFTVDVTNNLKLRNLEVSDFKKLPSDLRRIIVGRSPYLQLDDGNGTISKMLHERNITLVVEGKVACCCGMGWMSEIEKENPHLLEIDTSRAMCSRVGTEVDNKLPEDFWKKPTVANFLKAMQDEKVGACKKGVEKPTKPVVKQP